MMKNQEEVKRLTLGERKIRPDFAKTPEVKEVKQLFTFLFDKIEGLAHTANKGEYTSEVADALDSYRKSLDALETSAMYAVKAMTV